MNFKDQYFQNVRDAAPILKQKGERMEFIENIIYEHIQCMFTRSDAFVETSYAVPKRNPFGGYHIVNSKFIIGRPHYSGLNITLLDTIENPSAIYDDDITLRCYREDYRAVAHRILPLLTENHIVFAEISYDARYQHVMKQQITPNNENIEQMLKKFLWGNSDYKLLMFI